MNLKDIKPNPNNPRIIKDDKFHKLVKSIQEFPKMLELRPMVVNEHNILLGGNMRLKALQHLGYTDIPETWVRKASELTEDEQRQFIIKDNVGYGEWDWEMLANEWNSKELIDWGLDVPEAKDYDATYTTKVESPIYEVTKEKPDVESLCNLGKYNELMDAISKSKLDDKEKIFLQLAATRHIEFNYAEVAEYYAHSDKDVQELMENSALVIIDYNKAIELGFVKLFGELETLSNSSNE